jgi:hypothetical protein
VSPAEVEFTADGYLRLDADVARRYFPDDALVAVPHGRELWLLPLVGPEGGGLLLKQRNRQGDRAALVWESLAGDRPVGTRAAVWDATSGALRVDVSIVE